MRIELTAKKFYEWVGKIVFWGALVFYILYNAYCLGLSDGKTQGYVRGYVDGMFHLRPADPNLSPSEREEKQKDGPQSPMPKLHKGEQSNATSIQI